MDTITLTSHASETQTRSGADMLLKDFLGCEPSPPLDSANKCLGLEPEEQSSVLESMYLTADERLCAMGILADIHFSKQFVDTQIDLLEQSDPELHATLTADPKGKAPKEIWAQNMPMTGIFDLLSYGVSIDNKSTILYSVNLLSTLERSPYSTNEAYQAAYEAETIYAPLCEVIGMDGLASALRSKVACMQLINNGEGHFVDEAERILSYYLGDSDGRKDHCQIRDIAQHVVDVSVGSNSHDLVLGSDSNHGIIIGEGSCSDKRLRLIWRLKSVGSLAKRLKRTYEVSDDDPKTIEMPLDILGITLVANNEDHLAETYVDMIKNLRAADEVVTFPSPAREEAYHIRGSEEFVGGIMQTLETEFPRQNGEFEYKIDDTGFLVAKITGFIELNAGCFGFELQTLTQEGRHNSRSGKAAHIFYKLMRQLGKKHEPSEEELKMLAKINHNYQDPMTSNTLNIESKQRALSLFGNK